MPRTTTIAMLDRVDQIRNEELPPLEAQIATVREKAEAEYDDPWEIPDDMENKYDRLQQQEKQLSGEANVLERYAEEWGGDGWEIRELSVGSLSRIQDDVAEASNVTLDGKGTPKGGYARKRTLEIAVKGTPAQAPEIGNLPDAVGDWLFECVEEFNTTGDVELGNSSLRADLMKSES